MPLVTFTVRRGLGAAEKPSLSEAMLDAQVAAGLERADLFHRFVEVGQDDLLADPRFPTTRRTEPVGSWSSRSSSPVGGRQGRVLSAFGRPTARRGSSGPGKPDRTRRRYSAGAIEDPALVEHRTIAGPDPDVPGLRRQSFQIGRSDVLVADGQDVLQLPWTQDLTDERAVSVGDPDAVRRRSENRKYQHPRIRHRLAVVEHLEGLNLSRTDSIVLRFEPKKPI